MSQIDIKSEFSHVSPRYFDYNSTTPLPKSLLEKIEKIFTHSWINPSSTHIAGQQAKEEVEDTRIAFMKLTDETKSQVIFCGSATEAANIAIYSIVNSLEANDLVLVSNVEHSCLLTNKFRQNWTKATIKEITVDQNGILRLDELKNYCSYYGARLKAVVVQAANNETGVIQPIEEIRNIVGDEVVLLVDCSQSLGKTENWRYLVELADIAIFSPHKFYGPKGIGILSSNSKVSLKPIYFGGNQEYGIRHGSINFPALKLVREWIELVPCLAKEFRFVTKLRDFFETKILETSLGIAVLGKTVPRIGNTSALVLPDIDTDALIASFGLGGFMISNGSACHSGAVRPSHVYLAYGIEWNSARSIVRITFGFGHDTTITADLFDKISSYVSLTGHDPHRQINLR